MIEADIAALNSSRKRFSEQMGTPKLREMPNALKSAQTAEYQQEAEIELRELV